MSHNIQCRILQIARIAPAFLRSLTDPERFNSAMLLEILRDSELLFNVTPSYSAPCYPLTARVAPERYRSLLKFSIHSVSHGRRHVPRKILGFQRVQVDFRAYHTARQSTMQGPRGFLFIYEVKVELIELIAQSVQCRVMFRSPCCFEQIFR